VGLREATGRYVYFLDADDFIARQCLSRLYQKATSCDADIVFCGCDRVDPSGEVQLPYDERFRYIEGAASGSQSILGMLQRTIWVCACSGLYQKRFLDENGLRFTDGCTGGEDIEFIVKAMFHSKRVVSVSEVLSYYVQRPKDRSIEFDVLKQRQLDAVAAHYRIVNYLEQHCADDRLVMTMKSYVTRWFIPSVIASLLVNGGSVREIMSAVKDAGEVGDVSADTDYSWLPSWKSKVLVAVGNWLLDSSPRLFCWAARLRHALRM